MSIVIDVWFFALMSVLDYSVPTPEEISGTVQQKFSKRPCKFQIDLAIAQLSTDKKCLYRPRVVCVAGTGSGKSLAFFKPFPFNDGGISIMVTPLNVLAEQMASISAKLNITVANLTGDYNLNIYEVCIIYFCYQMLTTSL